MDLWRERCYAGAPKILRKAFRILSPRGWLVSQFLTLHATPVACLAKEPLR